MRGYAAEGDAFDAGDELAPWEALVVEAVGTVIDFWRFKRNQGRVWALIYLRGRPLSAVEIQRTLSLSKGAVSMLVRELERWGVVHRVRTPGEGVWRYAAEHDLMRMVTRVIEERESEVVARVKADLERAEQLAREAGDVPEAVLTRIVRLRRLADVFERALQAFVKTARLDMQSAFAVFGAVRDRVRKYGGRR